MGLKVQQFSGPITEVIDPFRDSAPGAEKASKSRHFPGLRLLLRKRPVEGADMVRHGPQISFGLKAEKTSDSAAILEVGQAR